KAAGANARLMTITPLDFDRQHVHGERFQSAELLDKPPTARHPERREVLWSPRAGAREVEFTAIYDFYCDMDVSRPSTPMTQLTKTLYAPPRHGEQLESEPLIESDHAAITALALRVVAGRGGPFDQMQALYQYVDQQVGNDPSVGALGMGAVDCLRRGRGDSRAKSRLLVALCRNRGIPARLVTGRAVRRGREQARRST